MIYQLNKRLNSKKVDGLSLSVALRRILYNELPGYAIDIASIKIKQFEQNCDLSSTLVKYNLSMIPFKSAGKITLNTSAITDNSLLVEGETTQILSSAIQGVEPLYSDIIVMPHYKIDLEAEVVQGYGVESAIFQNVTAVKIESIENEINISVNLTTDKDVIMFSLNKLKAILEKSLE